MPDVLPGVSLVVRPSGLDVRDLGDSVVVYDADTRRTIALQSPASTLFTALLQNHDATVGVLRPEGLASGTSDDIEAAIVDLETAGLIAVHDE